MAITYSHKLLLMFFVGLLSFSKALSQKLNYYNVVDGLSNSSITALLQDHYGYLWIGTSNGLNRFNGYDFKIFKSNFNSDNSINSNNIKCIYEDSHDNLWVGQIDGNISRIDQRNGIIKNFSCYSHASAKRGDIAAIVEGKDHNLWIAVDRFGFVCMNPKNGKILLVQNARSGGLTHNAVTDMICDKAGNLWLTTWGGGLNKYNPRSRSFSYFLSKPDQQERKVCVHNTCLFQDKQGYIWVGSTHSGAYRINPITNTIKHFPENYSSNTSLHGHCVYSIVGDKQGNVWISTGKGISIYHPDTRTFTYIDPNTASLDFTSDDIRKIYFDNVGDVWIGTEKGLFYYYYRHLNFAEILHTSLFGQDLIVRAVIKDLKDNVWMQTNHGLLRIPPGSKGFENITPILPDPSVRTLFLDGSGNVWIGYHNDNITRYNPQNNTYTNFTLNNPSNPNYEPFRTVTTFSQDPDGFLWIGTEVGLLRFDPITGQSKALIHSTELIYPDQKVTAIYRDLTGTLWVGTEGGLLRYSKDLRHKKIYRNNPSVSTSLPDNNVTSIFEDSHKRLWIGTMAGLACFCHEQDSFSTIAMPCEAQSAPVMAIEEDSRGYLWLSSTVGLIRYSFNDNTFHKFDANDGLQKGEFGARVAWKGYDGELFFGGISGANRFYPDSIRLDSVVPKVYIEGLYLFNELVEPGEGTPLKIGIIDAKRIDLSYWQSTLSLQFAVHEFNSPEKIFYAYKLEGVDKDWIYANVHQRLATYAHLAPGKYVFKVKASNSDGIWNEKPTELTIVVHPPFWRTWWAYASYVVLAGLLIYYLSGRRVKREQEKNKREVEKIKEKQEKQLYEMKFKFFTNISHEFRTSLTLILGPLEQIINSKEQHGDNKKLLSIIHNNTVRLTRLVNQFLDFRKIEAHKMKINKTMQDIVPFMHNVFDIFLFEATQQHVDYSFESSIDSLSFSFDADKLEKSVYNLLTNAFKYTNTSNGKVTLLLDSFVRDEKIFVTIKVSDNGDGISEEDQQKIFDIFFQASDNGNKCHGGVGIGLNMTKELVALMDGTITVSSLPGNGSVFTITLPTDSLNAGQSTEEVGHEMPAIDKGEEEETVTEEKSVSKDDQCDCILVVEDNADMRDYIRTILGSEYQIITAKNGVEGLSAAIEQMPDIIITDIMMPEMNGFQLFEHLRSDKRVNYIPVIMLTAVNDEQHVVKNYEKGVDDYITKPFSAAMLKARVANILAKRKEMWKHTGKAESKYQQKVINPFVAEMEKVVSQHLSEPDFGVDALASNFNMSSQQLTRKAKALMEITPYKFIIKMRMETAVNLLKTTNLNITEIAFRCGYQEVSNFSRSFTQYWGKSPMQYNKGE